MAGTAPLELGAWTCRGEPVGYEEAVRQRFEPIQVGDRWGPPWSTTWIRVRGTVPPEWRGRTAVAAFDLGFQATTGFTCEALAWRGGLPWRGVDPNHRRLTVDGRFDFFLEAAANPKATLSGNEPAPSMMALRDLPEPAFTLRQAELQMLDESQRIAALDFKVLLELSEALPPGRRRDEIHAALERFIDSRDHAHLAGVMRGPGSPDHTVHATGHAHIDTAWLWPLREARRKCARTFSTQLALMDEYPDHRFACSQPAQYEWMKESYPAIWEGIKAKVASGQWEPAGAMWVEADCNLPSGEALVRQLLHGKRFFMREFGRETKVLWLPDVFGYPGSLPQLIAAAGCEWFMTQKLSWNDTNPPEHQTFFWEGIDGTRIFTHFPPADTYNGDFSAGQVVESAASFKDRDRSAHSLYLFGWGDGGGGPEADMIESARRLRDFDGAPRVELSTADAFFQAAAAQVHDLATVKGELYFELHRGTYTSQSRTKRLNRQAQQALREAEMWSVAAGRAYPGAELDAAWKTLLLNQFHDILPGSSIDWVYEDAERDLQRVVDSATALSEQALATIAGDGPRTAVFNSTSHWRNDVPPCGWAVFETRPPDPEGSLENEFLRVTLGADGTIASIWDKGVGREVLSGPGNVLELHEDNPKRWDAWDIDIEQRDAFTVVGRRFGESSVTQRITLEGRVLRFETKVDWHERHKLLKVAFPVTVKSREAVYEIQFGHVSRPTHQDDSRARAKFEVCAQRWADLGDGRYGIALLNDCKHGYDIHDSVMRLSLLRAPAHPDPNADQGKHRFTYALMPHPGDFREAGVIQAAEDLNAKLCVVRTSLPAASRSLVEVDTLQVIVESVKRAEDSEATVVRLYEAWGRPCRAMLKTTLPATRAYLCDLLERDREEVRLHDGEVELDLPPFRILTLKLAP